MDLRKLKKLIDLVEASGISEIEVTEGEEKVRISKTAPAQQTHSYITTQAPVMQQQTAPMAPAPSVTTEVPLAVETGKIVKSPMVGMFYRSPSPGAKPFLDLGQNVAIGDTLCIIEAMKLLNEIESEFSGVVRSVLVEDGQPVEYGQPLFILD